VAKDLESFAKHANRTTVNTDDVMLLTRRNEGLEAVLRSHLDDLRKEKGTAPSRTAGKGKGKARK
jgi:centromere protein S